MYSVADTLLRWDEISLQRFVQEGHLYSIYLVYLEYREIKHGNGDRN